MGRLTAFGLYARTLAAGACFLLLGASLVAAESSNPSQGPHVSAASRHGVSPPQRDFRLVGPPAAGAKRQVHNELALPKRISSAGTTDHRVQGPQGGATPPPAILGQFDGGSDADNGTIAGISLVPPDTNGDVGPNNYVQFINVIWTVYDKSGAIVLGPLPGNSPFVGFGGPCEANNNGDPMVKYDRLADRWVMTQFAIPNYPNGPSYQCFAVSQTGDPTGAYNLYEFTIGSLAQGWGDYPKLGIWPDGYYIAFNTFTASAFTGMTSAAFDRTAMLAGGPATMVSFLTPPDGGGLPSDMDGLNPPPEGAPNYFMTWWDPTVGTLNIYQFHVDFATPANSTFTGPVEFGNAPFVFPPCPGSTTCVPQLGGEILDTLGDRLMNRLAYRNWGDHESLVTNHTVDAGGRTGVRWYEVRDPGGTPTMYQASTFTPDTTYRWMASITQDASQNMALGFSKSDAASFPSIGIVGRLAGDTLSTMGSENIWFAGTGSQINSFNRWGDYSSMSLDPVDECTFWYTQEYYATTTDFDFKTRIGSFKYPSCVSPPGGKLEGDVTDGTNPIAGAVVTAGASSRMTDAAGHYSFEKLPVGSYDMTVTKTGFDDGTATASVTDAGDTVQNFTLAPNAGNLEGHVTDGTNPISGATVTAGANNTLTDGTGFYSFSLLPEGPYDMTASKTGYLPASVPGVVVTAGETTIQDFVLTPSASNIMNGVVKDGSGGNWPLYARLDITTKGFSDTRFTDPISGYYSLTIPAGFTYHVVVTSVIPGYNPKVADVFVPVPAAAPAPNEPLAFVQNFDLTVDAGLCNAPGYIPGDPGPVVWSESFDGGVLPAGWSVINNTGAGAGWLIQSDFAPCNELSGNPTGGSGPFALVNSDCDGFVTLDEELRTASIDFSAYDGAILTFKQEYHDIGNDDTADVDVSIDGGATWNNVLRQTADARGPSSISTALAGVGGTQAQIRFHYYNAFFAWWWAVDDLEINSATCTLSPTGGGLVVGNVSDGNTGEGLIGAKVKNTPDGEEATTFATPEDPNVPDGFYAVFAGSGPQPFEASDGKYVPLTLSTNVIPNSTVRLDFALAAGWLSADQSSLTSKVLPGFTDTQTLNIINSGDAPGTFEIQESNAPLPTESFKGHFASKQDIKRAEMRIPKGWRPQGAMSAKGLPPLFNAFKPKVINATGDVLTSYPLSFGPPPAGLPYGLLLNPSQGMWVSNIGVPFSGDETDRLLTLDGTETGDSIDLSSVPAIALDGALNSTTGMLWQSLPDFLGGSQLCVFEIDPVGMTLTGNSICPNWSVPQNAVVYDPATDTYFAAGFFDAAIYHFDGAGNILDSVSPGLVTSGMAFNAATRHLFVVQQASPSVVVLDPDNGYTEVTSFDIAGTDFTNLGGAELDCDGHLWVIDQLGANPVLVVESGEEGSGPCTGPDVPWVSEDPTTGTVPPAGGGGARVAGGGGGTNPFPVAVTFDSANLFPGLRQGQLKISTDTPYPVDPVGLNFTVRFLDVPLDVPPGTNPFENFIYGAAGANIMHGCSFFNFCPNSAVTRADMAGYIWRALHGAFASPPAYTGIFADVFFGDYNADYIQGVWDDGITAGCNASPLLYCPNFFINRGQMAVFIEKDLRGPDFVPPPCTGIFGDVPCPATPQDPFADWIEQLFNDGITSGCQQSPPLFCPNIPIPNEQMAVFIVKAFELPVLP